MSAPLAILPDTSVWINHFRTRDTVLEKLLKAGRVRMHPYVVSELALGSLAKREETLTDLRTLPAAPLADQKEIDQLIEVQRLYSRSIGFVDAHLIASALLDGNLAVWTLDKRFASLAEELGVRAPF